MLNCLEVEEVSIGLYSGRNLSDWLKQINGGFHEIMESGLICAQSCISKVCIWSEKLITFESDDST